MFSITRMSKYPVSVVISALNEEKRIKDAIESARQNNPFEIIVVEGGSTDNTYSIAKVYADIAFSVNESGLGYKRAFGVEKATQKYILTLDADQVLEERALEIMINELEKDDFVGIQASLKSVCNETYWEKAMEYNVAVAHVHTRGDSHYNESYPIEAIMIGTPALFKADILKSNSFDKSILGSCDDTDLCYRLTKKGFKLGISSALCYQKHRSDFKTTFKKFYWYGEGDCEFAFKHTERFWSIFSHPLKNYFYKKSFKAIKNGNCEFVPFFMFIGLVRHIGFYKHLFKRILGVKIDSRSKNVGDYNY